MLLALGSECAPFYKEDHKMSKSESPKFKGIKEKRDSKVEKKVRHRRLCPADNSALE